MLEIPQLSTLEIEKALAANTREKPNKRRKDPTTFKGRLVFNRFSLASSFALFYALFCLRFALNIHFFSMFLFLTWLKLFKNRKFNVELNTEKKT